MDVRPVVLVVVSVLVVALTATGTQSFSAGQVERGFSAQVVSDEDAYLGLSRDVTDGDGRTLTVEVRHNVPSEQSLAVVVDVHHGGSVDTKQTVLVPGESARLEFSDVSCDATTDIVATGPTVRIELTREVPCSDSTDETEDTADGTGRDADETDDDVAT